MGKVKEIIVPAVALFIICLVSSVLLAVTNSVTKDKIEDNLKNEAAASRKVAFENAASFGDDEVIDIDGTSVTYCEAFDEANNKIGYVFTSAHKGYGGEVKVMTGVDGSGQVLRSVVLAMDDETPGLGQNASKPDFLDNFSGKTGPFSWVKSGGDGNEIKGVTSASFTSKAVIACVNDAVSAYAQLGG